MDSRNYVDSQSTLSQQRVTGHFYKLYTSKTDKRDLSSDLQKNASIFPKKCKAGREQKFLCAQVKQNASVAHESSRSS